MAEPVVQKRVSKKRKFVADGVFFSELNELFSRELVDSGFAGAEVRNTPARTEIVLRATKPNDVLGENGRRIHELTAVVQQRFNFAPGTVELFAERVENRGLCAEAQVENLKAKLLQGMAARRAAYSVLRVVRESGATGCEVVISGKLRGQRAKGMKFRDGYMVKSGESTRYYVRQTIRHVMLKQGIIGVCVKIMLAHDPTGRDGPSRVLSDVVTVAVPKDEDIAPIPAQVPSKTPIGRPVGAR